LRIAKHFESCSELIDLHFEVTSYHYNYLHGKILILKEGAVLEFGDHAALLKNNLFYKEVFDIQSSIEDSIQE